MTTGAQSWPKDRRIYLLYAACALSAANMVWGFVTETSHRTPHHLFESFIALGGMLFLAFQPVGARAWRGMLVLTMAGGADVLWTLSDLLRPHPPPGNAVPDLALAIFACAMFATATVCFYVKQRARA